MEDFLTYTEIDEILENINLDDWALIFEEESLKKSVAGVAGGFAGMAAASKVIHKNARKNKATRVLQSSQRTGNLTGNLLTLKKKKFIRALRKLRNAFSGKNLPKSLGLLGLSIAIGNLVFGVGSSAAKAIVAKLENSKKKELEIQYKMSITKEEKELEKLQQELEQIKKSRENLKNTIESKIEAKKKLSPEKLKAEKEKAKIETQKLFNK